MKLGGLTVFRPRVSVGPWRCQTAADAPCCLHSLEKTVIHCSRKLNWSVKTCDVDGGNFSVWIWRFGSAESCSCDRISSFHLWSLTVCWDTDQRGCAFLSSWLLTVIMVGGFRETWFLCHVWSNQVSCWLFTRGHVHTEKVMERRLLAFKSLTETDCRCLKTSISNISWWFKRNISITSCCINKGSVLVWVFNSTENISISTTSKKQA